MKIRTTLSSECSILCKEIHHPNAEYTKYTNQNSKFITQKNSKYAQYHFPLFCRDAIFVANLRTFLAYKIQAKKCSGVHKMTNMRYGVGCVAGQIW